MAETCDAPILTARFGDVWRTPGICTCCSARKGGSVPYMTHLLSVAALVLEDGGDGETRQSPVCCMTQLRTRAAYRPLRRSQALAALFHPHEPVAAGRIAVAKKPQQDPQLLCGGAHLIEPPEPRQLVQARPRPAGCRCAPSPAAPRPARRPRAARRSSRPAGG